MRLLRKAAVRFAAGRPVAVRRAVFGFAGARRAVFCFAGARFGFAVFVVARRAFGFAAGRLAGAGEPVARVVDLPWEEADEGHLRRAVATDGRVVLAGGLHSGNVRAAIEAVRIAVKYRTPVYLLSDAYLANGSEPWRIRSALPENVARSSWLRWLTVMFDTSCLLSPVAPLCSLVALDAS